MQAAVRQLDIWIVSESECHTGNGPQVSGLRAGAVGYWITSKVLLLKSLWVRIFVLFSKSFKTH